MKLNDEIMQDEMRGSTGSDDGRHEKGKPKAVVQKRKNINNEHSIK